jgi:hypothetical protein
MLAVTLRDDDGSQSFALEVVAPVAAIDFGDPRQIVLLDQEVRLGASTFARARRASDERRDAGGEAAIAQRLHLRDRASDRRNHRRIRQHVFGFVDRERVVHDPHVTFEPP